MGTVITVSVILIAVAALVLLTAFEKTRYVGKALISICIAIAAFIGILAVFIGNMMTGTPGWVLLLEFAIVILVATLILCAIWGKFGSKMVWLAAALLVCLCCVGGYIGHSCYVSSIPTVGESDDLLRQYRPYADGTEVAVLEEESTLKLESDLPKMDGATALFPVYSAFARAVYPESAISDYWNSECLDCSKTTRAYENIVTGEADIIFVAGPSEEQLQYAADNGVELVFTPVGREAFVFFVNSQNPLDDITYEQIQAIYSGELTRWEELGVPDLGKIRAFQRDKGSGSQSALERLMAGKNLVDPPMEDVVDGMGGIITRTADYRNFKNAIGFSFRFYSTEMVKNDQIRLLSINGIAPTLENIENGTYPIASEFYAVTRSDADENTLLLLEWVQSQQAQLLVEKTGYTPVN